jgi:hypothetical protein
MTHAILKAVLGRIALNIQIATNVIGTYAMLKIMLVIVTLITGTLNAFARGAATGVNEVWQQLTYTVVLKKKNKITQRYQVVLYFVSSSS